MNVLVLYDINQLVKPNVWDEEAYLIPIFGTMKFLKIDFMNMLTLLLCMANFIRNRGIDSSKINDVNQLQSFGQATCYNLKILE